MLGNFSFGDYFKKDAIAFAWELVTSQGMVRDSSGETVLHGFRRRGSWHGKKLETRIAKRRPVGKVGAPKDRVIAMPGLKENFWAMGDTGPCGPCTRNFRTIWGRLASEQGARRHVRIPDATCGRYVEIWNLVFMQFNRDASGELKPLPKPSVDTGMGLERIDGGAAGNVVSNYDTDLFVPLIERAAELCGVDLKKEEKLEQGRGGAASLRVIADHARATTFLISDGVMPSNEGRGYVLRKIMPARDAACEGAGCAGTDSGEDVGRSARADAQRLSGTR